jgi:hypothetical protein
MQIRVVPQFTASKEIPYWCWIRLLLIQPVNLEIQQVVITVYVPVKQIENQQQCGNQMDMCV